MRHRFEDLSGNPLKYSYYMTNKIYVHKTSRGYTEAEYLGISRRRMQDLQNIGTIDQEELIQRARQAVPYSTSQPVQIQCNRCVVLMSFLGGLTLLACACAFDGSCCSSCLCLPAYHCVSL